MNHHDPSKHDPSKHDPSKHVPSHADTKLSPEDEREWQLQERALHEERMLRDRRIAATGDDDLLLAQYRSVAHALRQESSAVPADFAASVLDAVQTAPAPAPAPASTGLERWLLRGLFAVFVLSGLAVAVLYGSQWLQGFVRLWSQAPSTSHNWLLALGACIAVSWSLRWLRWPHAQSNPG